MQTYLQYQAKHLDYLDFAITSGEPIEKQLAMAMERILGLQSGKDSLQIEILDMERALEIRSQLLRNAKVREQELQIQLKEYDSPQPGFKDSYRDQTFDYAFFNPASIGTWNCISLVRDVCKSFTSSLARWTKASQRTVWFRSVRGLGH